MFYRRRNFLQKTLGITVALTAGKSWSNSLQGPSVSAVRQNTKPVSTDAQTITLFLCGDVMTGRGIDQILPHANNPQLQEPYIRDARRYVQLAEQVNGDIEKPVDFNYIWGDTLAELQRQQADARIINLETSVTTSNHYWPGKGIHYRMHPKNLPCISAAGVHFSVLANNHVLDWGYPGLHETLHTLRQSGVHPVGAGNNLQEAQTPGILQVPGKGRVIVLGLGHPSSGIPRKWAATPRRAGVQLLEDLSERTIGQIARQIQDIKQHGDIVVASIHWGGNWGYEIPREQRRFAHKLIDEADVDVVHGHSSHHVMGIEVYQERLILYGCGDFLNDYEGIGGHESFRGDLSLMYFATVDTATGRLVTLRMTPTQVRRLRINRATQADRLWLSRLLNREGKPLGTHVALNTDGTLDLCWA
jgi:poly-gamma-glutamate synthesis protein (capsule biosynthesis protein)